VIFFVSQELCTPKTKLGLRRHYLLLHRTRIALWAWVFLCTRIEARKGIWCFPLQRVQRAKKIWFNSGLVNDHRNTEFPWWIGENRKYALPWLFCWAAKKILHFFNCFTGVDKESVNFFGSLLSRQVCFIFFLYNSFQQAKCLLSCWAYSKFPGKFQYNIQ
jgi:hypothetical protein